MAVSRLDDDQKAISLLPTLLIRVETIKVSAVNESGLYDLTLDSRKPEARRIRKWVVGDVMPTLRKTGRYQIGPPQIHSKDLIPFVFEGHKVRWQVGRMERRWPWPPMCAGCLGIRRIYQDTH